MRTRFLPRCSGVLTCHGKKTCVSHLQNVLERNTSSCKEFFIVNSIGQFDIYGPRWKEKAVVLSPVPKKWFRNEEPDPKRLIPENGDSRSCLDEQPIPLQPFTQSSRKAPSPEHLCCEAHIGHVTRVCPKAALRSTDLEHCADCDARVRRHDPTGTYI